MKISKKVTNKLKRACVGLASFTLASQVFAADKLAGVLNGEVQDLLGSQSGFWKIFILIDIILAAAMAVKAKNPMVFIGVFSIALIPGFLLNSFVFG